MGAAEGSAFLADLAVRQRVSASTQNQALSGPLFLYREVLRTPTSPRSTPRRVSQTTTYTMTDFVVRE